MRVIVWGINYSPEVTGIAPFNRSLCDFLQAAGDDVRMVTSFAYYPHWRKTPADAGRVVRTDVVAGVPVYRVWHYVPARVTTARRMLHELSFAISSTLRILFLPRAEVYVVVSPPLLLGPCAWLVTRLKRSQYVFHVQDLQPDAALGLGLVRPGVFAGFLYRLEAWAYRGASGVSGISRGMLQAFARKGVPAKRRWYFPNGIELEQRAVAAGAVATFRCQNGVASEALLAVYAGNIGKKQGLEILIEAAKVLSGQKGGEFEARAEVVIMIIGDGAERAALAAAVARANMLNVKLLPLLSEDDYRGALAATDVALITQAAGTGQYFFPSKLLTVLAAGRPVVTVADADSELAQAVVAGGFGRNVPPGDGAALVEVLRALAKERAVLADWAERARAWVQPFSRERVLADYVQQLRAITLPESK
jgi:colanic acid biosynthesis glycosyl transferase WcaI